ncbi:MAG TPA: hypothetical protein DCR74_07560 [Achromobacter sp.]|nr:hypothetical protein [Achromobacter sp.]
MTIIVVDDHGDWRDSIAEYIQDLGLDKAILTAGSLAELDKLLLTVTPAILVLDAMLPDGDGLARVSHLRTTYPSMGIIMLTGRLLSEDKVSGLSLGADHYLTKPVNLAELGATLVSLSRRLRVVPAAGIDDAQSDAWRFDPARRTLTSPGQITVDITDTESRLIGALIQAAPLPLSRARLVEALGAVRVPVSLPRTELAIPAYYVIAPAEASSNLARYDGVRYGHRAKQYGDLNEMISRSRAEGFGDEVKRRILIGTYVLSHGYYDAYYLQAQRLRRLIAQDFQRAYADQCDVIMGPVTPTVAKNIGDNRDDPTADWLADVYTLGVSLAGLPAMSIPCGFGGEKQNRPIGLQIIGNYFDEGRLLAIADRYQHVTDWHQRAPVQQG